jgi:hypothetical protein
MIQRNVTVEVEVLCERYSLNRVYVQFKSTNLNLC